MISVAEAIQIVIEQTQVLTTERLSIQDSLGRVLAQDVIADTDLPPFNRSQMDGYAVRSEETQSVPVRLRIVGETQGVRRPIGGDVVETFGRALAMP